MRNPEEYLDEVHFHKTTRNTLSQILSPDGIDDNMYERLLKAFSLIQKDAYNQAIQDVEVNIECCMNLSEGFEYPTVKWDSISKLKIK